jgi:ribosomal-protein-alanine N-acetyltransferase
MTHEQATDGTSTHRTRARLRPLRAADLPRVVELEVVLFRKGAWSYGMLADELGALGRWYVAAEEIREDRAGPGDVVGYAGLWFDGEISQIMTIGVAPRAQHCGIGSQLLDALIERSRELGAKAMLLEVAVTNQAALAMYGKYGFAQLSVRKRYYQPEDIDAYTMRLDLTAANPPHQTASPGPSVVTDPAGAASTQ